MFASSVLLICNTKQIRGSHRRIFFVVLCVVKIAFHSRSKQMEQSLLTLSNAASNAVDTDYGSRPEAEGQHKEHQE